MTEHFKEKDCWVDMNTLRNIDIDIRTQAVFILALAVIWCFSFLACIFEMGSTPFVYLVADCCLPLVMIVFSIILLVSNRRAGRKHENWVCAALMATIVCSAAIIGYVALAWYL